MSSYVINFKSAFLKMKLFLTFLITFYIDVKEMTAFINGNFTRVMGAVFVSLKSRSGKQERVRAEQQSSSY